MEYFTIVSNGKKGAENEIYYMDAEHRGRCETLSADCGDDILEFYGIPWGDHNQYNYDPVNDILRLDLRCGEDDFEEVHKKAAEINFDNLLRGLKVDEIKEFLRQAKEIKWYSNSGELPDNVRLFDTVSDARKALLQERHYDDSKRDWILGYILDGGSNISAVWYLEKLVREVVVPDAFLDALVYLFSANNFRDFEAFQLGRDRWKIWEAGYGVVQEVDGIFYCTKEGIR